MCIPVHPPWLPGSIAVTQTILVIVRMAGLFPDRPHMSNDSKFQIVAELHYTYIYAHAQYIYIHKYIDTHKYMII